MNAVFQLNPAQHAWLIEPGAQRLMTLVAQAGGEARFVGGCVRDALLGRPVGDRDLAVTLPPEQVMAILNANSIKTVPLGIDHGTVLAIVDGTPYEMTTLRADTETDGRHAKVTFIADWRTDAQRRDFTINALYADAMGQIYDYGTGLDDIKTRRLRFIGNPQARIEEDYLRALRYFRFCATLDLPCAEDQAHACGLAAKGVSTLSFERIWRELVKFLQASDPAPSWQVMKEHGLLESFLPEAQNVARLSRLVTAEKTLDLAPSVYRRLAALDGARKASLWPLSKREREKLTRLANAPLLDIPEDDKACRAFFYDWGSDLGIDLLALALADSQAPLATHKAHNIQKAIEIGTQWQRPVLPLQGADLVAMGYQPGPEIGVILREIEAWWRLADFQPTHTECAHEAANRK